MTNDGATILELMDVDHEVAKLMVSLSKSQDNEVGDGTTGVVVLAAALLTQALELLDKGVHPAKIADGYEDAARRATVHLENISFSVDTEDKTCLLQAARTALSSKVASKSQEKIAEIAVEAIKATNDLSKSPFVVNVNSIILKGKTGGQIEDSGLIKGVIIEKDFAHPHMKKHSENMKVAVFSSSALQLPVAQTKHQLNVRNTVDYTDIRSFIDAWCDTILNIILSSNAQLVVYSGKIEDSLVHLLFKNGISAIELVHEVEVIARSTGARVVPRAEELTSEKLGSVDKVSLIEFGTTKDKYISLENVELTKVATVFVRGNNTVVVEEVKRSIQDALCVVRNLLQEKAAVYGGGAAEMSCSSFLENESNLLPGVEQLVFQAFAEALDVIPLALAENTGLDPLQTLTQLKASHKPWLGVDCMHTGDCDMRLQGVIEGLHAKKQQLIMATQLAKMVLKVDDVRVLKAPAK